MVPVIWSLREVLAGWGPVRPMLARVSRTRVGSTVTMVDSVGPGSARSCPGVAMIPAVIEAAVSAAAVASTVAVRAVSRVQRVRTDIS